jgi:rubredoxin
LSLGFKPAGGKKLKKPEKWVCTICNYVYDPALGDPTANVPPGTAFEDLAEDWVCPECGAGKEEFKKV